MLREKSIREAAKTSWRHGGTQKYTNEMSWSNAKLQQNNLFIVMPNQLHSDEG